MRHRVYGRTLSRQANERKRLLRGLAREVILHGSITTTISKAKAVQPLVEKLVTHAKKGQGSNVREIRKVITEREVYAKLVDTATKTLADRTSGYTRMVKLGARAGDATEVVRFGFVTSQVAVPVETADPKAKTRKAAPKAVSKTVNEEKRPAKTVAKAEEKKVEKPTIEKKPKTEEKPKRRRTRKKAV